MNVFLQRKSEWSYQTTKYENCIDVSENYYIGVHLHNHFKYCSRILWKPLTVKTYGPFKSDTKNQMITIRIKSSSFYKKRQLIFL
jgi:hypothetical protein